MLFSMKEAKIDARKSLWYVMARGMSKSCVEGVVEAREGVELVIFKRGRYLWVRMGIGF